MIEPKVGDWADHKSRSLDPRPVSRVRRMGRGWQVWIMIHTLECGPLPASNYTYTTPKEVASP